MRVFSTAKEAVVLFSGGQDSSTCLAMALVDPKISRVHVLQFDYGQKHKVELKGSLELIGKIDALCKERFYPEKERLAKIVTKMMQETTVARQITALTDPSTPITVSTNALPNTFVPGRNMTFLMEAALYSYEYNNRVEKGLENGKPIATIVIGACEEDYSGYPDCRQQAISSMQLAINANLDTSFFILAPLMRLTKAETWQALGAIHEELIPVVMGYSHTCYQGVPHSPPFKHYWGYGCGECPACELRKKGVDEYLYGNSLFCG